MGIGAKPAQLANVGDTRANPVDVAVHKKSGPITLQTRRVQMASKKFLNERKVLQFRNFGRSAMGAQHPVCESATFVLSGDYD